MSLKCLTGFTFLVWLNLAYGDLPSYIPCRKNCNTDEECNGERGVCLDPGYGQKQKQCFRCACQSKDQCYLESVEMLKCNCSNSGYTGDHCEKDIDDCLTGDHNCHTEATCYNTEGGFQCTCNEGFVGNGITCLDCPSGWDLFDGSCYLFVTTYRGWLESQIHCESLDASLVSINDEDEDTYIKNTYLLPGDFGTGYVYIGGIYCAEYGEYCWVDGTNITYNGWLPGSPTIINGCMFHGQADPDWKWGELNCFDNPFGPSICEINLKNMFP